MRLPRVKVNGYVCLMPKVIASYAQSLDGRIATVTGDSQWISGPESLRLAHELRRDCDAILVGAGTVRKDNPQLSCRLPDGCPNQPLRVLLTRSLDLPLDAKIFSSQEFQKTLVLHTKKSVVLQTPSEASFVAFAKEHGIGYQVLEEGDAEMEQVLGILADYGVGTLFVEGGAHILTAFFRANLVDELWLVSAPLLIGAGIEAIGDLGNTVLTQAKRGTSFEVRQLGQDVLWKIRFS